jgi:integrase
MVIRLVSVSDQVDLPQFHEIFSAILGWNGDLGYLTNVHGQEFNSFRRKTRSKGLREFKLHRQEKFLYVCDTLHMWEWDVRVLDIEDGAEADHVPLCLDGRRSTPPESCGGPTGYRLMLKRQDRALLGVLVTCALRRGELSRMNCEHLVMRDGRWVFLDFLGKGNKTRSVAVPLWVKQEIDGWLDVAAIEKGQIFRRVLANGRVGKDALTERAVWQLVREYAAQIGIGELAPHDLRRTAAKLCRAKGGELEQIQFLLGHESILTTERYLGLRKDSCKSGHRMCNSLIALGNFVIADAAPLTISWRTGPTFRMLRYSNACEAKRAEGQPCGVSCPSA